MRLIFTFLSIAYIAGIFLWADSPVVSDFTPFNPYSLLHIPLYGVLAFLLIFSFFPFNFKAHISNVLNDQNHPNVTDENKGSMYLRFLTPGIIALIVAIADEINQSFIPTRDASVIDVFLDGVGIVLTLFLIVQLYQKKKFLRTETTIEL
jgi:hypothetical protein